MSEFQSRYASESAVQALQMHIRAQHSVYALRGEGQSRRARGGSLAPRDGAVRVPPRCALFISPVKRCSTASGPAFDRFFALDHLIRGTYPRSSSDPPPEGRVGARARWLTRPRDGAVRVPGRGVPSSYLPCMCQCTPACAARKASAVRHYACTVAKIERAYALAFVYTQKCVACVYTVLSIAACVYTFSSTSR